MKVEKELVEKTVETLKEVAEKVKGVEAWTLGSISDLAYDVVVEVEKVSSIDKLSGQDKLTLASKVLDYFWKAPGFIELFDDKIIKAILKGIVKALNKALGKDWLVKIGSNEATA